MYASISEAAGLLGISISTLRSWEREGKIKATYRTIGGHRRYLISELKEKFGLIKSSADRIVLTYSRVSSFDQKSDLERQKERLYAYCEKDNITPEEITDLGSGLNYKKKGLKKLIHLIVSGKVGRLILTHKDRLLRFGAEIIFYLCTHFGTKVELIDEEKTLSDEEILTRDVIELMTVFSSRMYGKRAHKNKTLQTTQCPRAT